MTVYLLTVTAPHTKELIANYVFSTRERAEVHRDYLQNQSGLRHYKYNIYSEPVL